MKSHNNLILNISDLFLQFQSKLNAYEREYLKQKGIDDVTPTEVKVLYIIGMSNTKSMSEIAEELKITRGTLSITVNNLVKKGYVIRTRNKQDRRIIILYLTQKSVDVVRSYGEFYRRIVSELISSVDVSKVTMIEEILVNLNTIIEEIFNNAINKKTI